MRKQRDGFFMFPNAVFANPALSGPDLLVYATLLYHANANTGECFPSIATIKREARLGARSVYQSLEKLEREHLIERRTSPGHVNHYYLTPAPQVNH